MNKNPTQMSRILKKLLFVRDMKPVDLARKVDLPPPTIHRFLTGKSKNPYKTSLEPIADYFGITTTQLLGDEPLPDNILREIDGQTHDNKTGIIQLPLLTWNALDYRNQPHSHCSKKIPFIGRISEQAFATEMPNTSMEPVFLKGSTLIFDPHKPATDRSYILVKLAQQQHYIFRQLVVDMDKRYLKPLNPDLYATPMRELSCDDEIIGILQEARQVFS